MFTSRDENYPTQLTAEEYLAMEERAHIRHEFGLAFADREKPGHDFIIRRIAKTKSSIF